MKMSIVFDFNTKNVSVVDKLFKKLHQSRIIIIQIHLDKEWISDIRSTKTFVNYVFAKI